MRPLLSSFLLGAPYPPRARPYPIYPRANPGGPLRELAIVRADAIQVLVVELFEVEQRVVRAVDRADQLVELDLDRLGSRFCVFWIRNTIRNVTIVVPVLMTSCHVSLKPNSGPVTAQTG